MLPIQKETATGEPHSCQPATGSQGSQPVQALGCRHCCHSLQAPATSTRDHTTVRAWDTFPALSPHYRSLALPSPARSTTKETIQPISHRRGTKINAHHRRGKLFKLERFVPGHPPLNSCYTLLYHFKLFPATPSPCEELSCPSM